NYKKRKSELLARFKDEVCEYKGFVDISRRNEEAEYQRKVQSFSNVRSERFMEEATLLHKEENQRPARNEK
ncbi:hypothetical protein K0M31_016833, partial [Melipona bicolor]